MVLLSCTMANCGPSFMKGRSMLKRSCPSTPNVGDAAAGGAGGASATGVGTASAGAGAGSAGAGAASTEGAAASGGVASGGVVSGGASGVTACALAAWCAATASNVIASKRILMRSLGPVVDERSLYANILGQGPARGSSAQASPSNEKRAA